MCFLLNMGIFHCYVTLPEGIILPWCCLCYTCCYLLRRGNTGSLLSFFLDKKKATVAKWSLKNSPQNDEFPWSHRESRLRSLLLLEARPTHSLKIQVFFSRDALMKHQSWPWNRTDSECAISIMGHTWRNYGAPRNLRKAALHSIFNFYFKYRGGIVDFLVEKNRCVDFLFFLNI